MNQSASRPVLGRLHRRRCCSETDVLSLPLRSSSPQCCAHDLHSGSPSLLSFKFGDPARCFISLHRCYLGVRQVPPHG